MAGFYTFGVEMFLAEQRILHLKRIAKKTKQKNNIFFRKAWFNNTKTSKVPRETVTANHVPCQTHTLFITCWMSKECTVCPS